MIFISPMHYQLRSLTAEKLAAFETDCLVVGVFQGSPPALEPGSAALDGAGDGPIQHILARGDIAGKPGDVLWLRGLPGLRAARVVLIGLGEADHYTLESLRKAAAALMGALQPAVANAALWLPPAPNKHNLADAMREWVQTLSHSAYRYRPKQTDKLTELTFLTPGDDQKAAAKGLAEGEAIAAGVQLTRQLGNTPGNICTPAYLREQAEQLAKECHLAFTSLSEEQMRRENMQALLAVGQGSREPSQLFSLEYNGAAEGAPPVVLVGKGVTFDTGGISIKPAAAMDEMKFDMCGAASVLGTMRAAAGLQLPINLVGVVAAAENMPGGAAVKPGDVVQTMHGSSVEILNTDAEGRLVLCDALTWSKRFNPALVIDIATLTGACIVALGKHASGLFSNDDPLAKALIAAGQATGDRAWRLPVWDDYARDLKSNFADIANVGGRMAGAVTAACFLHHFTKNYVWAHLDIAGTAWLSGASKGATGRPVPLLVEFLRNRAYGSGSGV